MGSTITGLSKVSDTLYYFRKIGTDNCEVAKFVDGGKRPDEVYKIINGQCNCHRAWNGKHVCKHMTMYTYWVNRGAKSEAVDYDANVYYSLEKIYGQTNS